MKKTLLMGFLGVVMGVSASMASVTEVAAAEESLAPCCSFCDARVDRCVAGCETAACETACFNTVRGCYNVCVMSC
ncbi:MULTISPECIES: hypothetical protein [Myxococcus]|uniref:hypothetical protein n=1 Tax=Myxococcus TaxID=32 RepID=UPI0013D29089|nr:MULTISPECIES: hypothetical protein [Myxococcus]NVJ23255.1 hypothetical protein [Myxococcus sp. AM011]